MNIVDSCGWLEYFADGPNAVFFAPPIEDTKNLIVPAICIFEVFKCIHQQLNEDAALQAVALMHQAKVISFNDSSALYAAKLSIDYNLPMADSIILATARLEKAQLWTQDKDFEKIKGVKYIKTKK